MKKAISFYYKASVKHREPLPLLGVLAWQLELISSGLGFGGFQTRSCSPGWRQLEYRSGTEAKAIITLNRSATASVVLKPAHLS